jgi:histidyl-tRNA synthetase
MAILTKAPRGTADSLPGESYILRKVENEIISVAENFGFKEIRTPTFEHTELFNRSVGDTTDVVQKEMYTFTDKGDRSITLRPEGTAGALRAIVEHGLLNEAMPLKVYYLLSCFRYEKPQAGRMREFHQFGVEMLGTTSPLADAEVISLADAVLKKVGVKDVSLEINSLGCKECRPLYMNELRKYFKNNSEDLCETCKGRLEKNPLRILDCKSPICKEIAKNAPKVVDFLCEDCETHFGGVKTALNNSGIEFKVNPDIVRGLDYYNRTVFEFVSNSLGSQGTVCGGGRYDGLTASLGGADCASLGFGMGMERLLMLYRQAHPEEREPSPKIYIASLGEKAALEALKICVELRKKGVSAECDTVGRGLKAQMKYADKKGAEYSVVLGDDEISKGTAVLKNMRSGETREVEISKICEAF